MNRWLCVCILSAALLLGATPVWAQEGYPPALAPINVAAQRGQIVSRTFVIQTTAPLTNVQIVVPQDLRLAEATGDRVLPASIVRVQLSGDTVPARDLLTTDLTFDLTAAPSGQFTGELLVKHDGGSFSVPVTVSVKDRPWFPLGLLIAGVALGVGVSRYRQQGLPRDEVVVQLSQLRAQMQVDEDLREEGLGQPFLRRIGTHLAEADVALQAQRWPAAQTALAQAEQVLRHWRSGRPDWLAQIEYYQALMRRLAGLHQETSFYVGEVRQAALDAYRSLPELDDPRVFRAQLEPLARQLNEYLTLQARIEGLTVLGDKYKSKARALLAQLNALSPQDADGRTKLHTGIEQTLQAGVYEQLLPQLERLKQLSARLNDAEAAENWTARAQAFHDRAASEEQEPLLLLAEVNAAVTQVENLLDPTRDAGMAFGVPKGGAALEALGGAGSPPQWLSGVPGISVQSLPQAVTGARRRMAWFTRLTYGVAVTFLALSGFVELYSHRVDFGARGVGDYFTLLAWGFGAEATRSAIADMVAGWGISTHNRQS